jgi:uncharacterized protein (DUF1810 family)
MDDPFNLARFVAAQDGIYDVALSEIRSGRKHSHWMWFVFPQIAGLGSSPMSTRYAISSVDEARAYLDHPVLGPRYRECVGALQGLPGRNAEEVFGRIDAQKLQSSLTLFSAMRDDGLFEAALDRWFDGRRDEATLRILQDQGRGVRGENGVDA